MVIDPSEFTRQLAGIFRAELGRADHSQAWLAQVLGISQAHMSRVLKGRRPMDTDQLAVLCQLFGRSLTSVITEAEQRSEQRSRESDV